MPLSLPYYRDASELPGPLPDQNEIAQAEEIIPMRSEFGPHLVVVRDKFAVKYGPFVSENEGDALLFVEQLNIAAPRLYAMYRDQDNLYIVMEYIPGISLGTAWPLLTKANKHSIADQLRQIFNQMRTLPSPGFYGSVSKGPVPHRYFYSHEGDPAITGPFQTEEEFGRAIALRSKRLWTEFDNPSFHSDFLARHLPVALCDHPIVFTHGDLHRENVVVRKIVGSDTEEEYEVAALVGWETAGWYPSYWEYAYIFPVLQWNDDWPEIVEKILDPFVLEGAMMSVVFRNMEF